LDGAVTVGFLGREISVRNVSKGFGVNGEAPRNVFENFDFTVKAGEAVAVLGPSGCGKTTLLRLIAGLEAPTNQAGEVRVAGKLVTEPGPDRGFVFQQYSSFPWLTAEDNIKVPLRRLKLGQKQVSEIVGEYLALVGLKDYARSYPSRMSGGQQQRLALARTLAAQPAVMLLDEPYAALDAQTREAMQDELLRIGKRLKPTILFVTHDIREAIRVGERIVVLSLPPARILLEVFSLPLEDRIALYAAHANNGMLPSGSLEKVYALERRLRKALSDA
jgi:NitT/TauT family transport system ATP-binding protein